MFKMLTSLSSFRAKYSLGSTGRYLTYDVLYLHAEGDFFFRRHHREGYNELGATKESDKKMQVTNPTIRRRM
jgi:hypothetical protein